MVEEVQPAQAEVTPAETQPGVTQVEVPPTEVRSEQVTEPQKETKAVETKEKVYTQAEVEAARAEVMSAKDREIAEHRQLMARMVMERQIAEAQAAEAQVRARDNSDVESGLITTDEATQRQRARVYTSRLQQEAQQIFPVVHALRNEGEGIGMAVSVYHTVMEVAKEDKLNRFETIELFDKMMSGEKLTHPEQVKTKAANLKLAKAQEALRVAKTVPEKFDSGQGSGAVSEEQSLKARYPTMYRK